MNELISVIMSVYKEEKDVLTEAINSILNQTYDNFEFIIIIDNPEDTWRKDYINSIRSDKIKLIVNDKNIGLPKSLNKGLDAANGKYIARMDADDIAEITRLEKQKKFLEEKKYDLCGSNFECFYNDSDKKNVKNPQYSKNVNKLLKTTNCVGHPTWFGKTEVFRCNNGYRNVFSCEDYDFLLRAVKNGAKIGNVQEVLLHYRINKNSISRSNSGKQILIADYLKYNYKKNKIPTEQEIKGFQNTKKFKKRLEMYNKYYLIKYKKNMSNSNKLLKIAYSINLIMYLPFFLKDLFRVITTKIIIYIDKKEN